MQYLTMEPLAPDSPFSPPSPLMPWQRERIEHRHCIIVVLLNMHHLLRLTKELMPKGCNYMNSHHVSSDSRRTNCPHLTVSSLSYTSRQRCQQMKPYSFTISEGINIPRNLWSRSSCFSLNTFLAWQTLKDTQLYYWYSLIHFVYKQNTNYWCLLVLLVQFVPRDQYCLEGPEMRKDKLWETTKHKMSESI